MCNLCYVWYIWLWLEQNSHVFKEIPMTHHVIWDKIWQIASICCKADFRGLLNNMLRDWKALLHLFIDIPFSLGGFLILLIFCNSFSSCQ